MAGDGDVARRVFGEWDTAFAAMDLKGRLGSRGRKVYGGLGLLVLLGGDSLDSPLRFLDRRFRGVMVLGRTAQKLKGYAALRSFLSGKCAACLLGRRRDHGVV